MQPITMENHQQSKYTSLKIDQLLRNLRQQHAHMRLDNCHQIVKVIQSRYEQLTKQDYDLIEISQSNYQAMLQALKCLDIDSSEWPTKKIGNKQYQGTISNKVYGSSGIEAQIKGQFQVNGPNLLSLVYEQDLFPQWVPFCCESKLIHEVSPTQKFVFVKFGFPYISTRQIIFFGQAYDRFEHNGTVLINMRGVTENQKFQKQYGVKLVAPGKKGVQFLSEHIVIQMNIKDPAYKFRTYSNVDLKVLYIPQFVVNFFAKKIGNFVFENVVDRAATFKNTQWQKRMQKDEKGIYKKINSKLKQWGINRVEQKQES